MLPTQASRFKIWALTKRSIGHGKADDSFKHQRTIFLKDASNHAIL